MNVIFDAHALLVWLRREPNYKFVRHFMERSDSSPRAVGMCSVNVGEVYYILAREESHSEAENWLGLIDMLEWHVFPAHHDLVLAAARLKARFPLSYADAFALACAQEQGAALVTGDPEILAANHGIPILWPGVGNTPKEQPLEQ